MNREYHRWYNPSHNIPNEFESGRLHQLQQLDIIIASGQQDPNINNARYFSGELWHKGIWHTHRKWDGWAHNWPWWHQMRQHDIGGSD